MNTPLTRSNIREATLAARQRLGDESICVAVRRGKLDIVRVTYDAHGRSTVNVLERGLTSAQCIVSLDRIQP